jgi:hypothetical protein
VNSNALTRSGGSLVVAELLRALERSASPDRIDRIVRAFTTHFSEARVGRNDQQFTGMAVALQRAPRVRDARYARGATIMTRGVGGQSPSNVQSYLKGVSYPASREDLIAAAKRNRAPEEVMKILIDFEEGENFGGPQEVMKAYGQERS